MKPSQLKEYLKFAIVNKEPVLLTSSPGVGKTAIIKQVCKELGVKLILSHPTISEPTDYKGLPFAVEGEAEFLPYGDLRKLINAKETTVCLFDDIGQSSAMVQASLMQILWGGQIGNHEVSEHVTFLGATNRKQDKAGVTGLLEPVKSRFGGGIIELEVSVDDWVQWSLENDMPIELISFVRFKRTIFDDIKLSKEIVNTISPRTVAAVGRVQSKGLSKSLYSEVFKGIAGEVFSTEYCAFLKYFDEMPDIDQIILNPEGTEIPKSVGVRYALTGALSDKADATTIESILKYTSRPEFDPELQTACMKNIAHGKNTKSVFDTRAFTEWAAKNKILNN